MTHTIKPLRMGIFLLLIALLSSPAWGQSLEEAIRLNNQAVELEEQGKYSEAIPLYERTLAIAEKVLGPDHPNVATTLYNLSWLYTTLGRYSDAEPVSKRALAIREKVLGMDHPDVAISLNQMAELYQAIGDYAQAELVIKRALAIREEALGPNHPDVARSLNNQVILLIEQARYQEAIPLAERALRIAVWALGRGHPFIADVRAVLAMLYLETGRDEEAFTIFKDLAQAVPAGLARYYLRKKNYEQAEQQFLFALKLAEGTGQPHFLISNYIGLGLSKEGQGDYSQARGYFQKAIDLIEKEWLALAPAARPRFFTGRDGNFARLEPYEGMVRVIQKEKKPGYQQQALPYAERIQSAGRKSAFAEPAKGTTTTAASSGQKAIIALDTGKIAIELYAKDAPETVANFVKLTRQGFYDGLTFHRVAPGFVVQGGDPKGDGTGGPGYTIKDEVSPRRHLTGAVAMAKTSQPNSGGSQFYITLAPQPNLNGKYTVFGQVVEGMELVKQIRRGDVIKKISITEEDT